jgi:serine/threonine protein kinase
MTEVNDGPRDLPSDAWRALHGIVQRFEDAWRAGQRPALDDFLPAAGPERQAALVELIHTELECRLKAGEAARVEEYLHRYPELADQRDVVLGLVAAEYDLRRAREPDLSPAEYRSRFPEYGPDLLARLSTASPCRAGGTARTQPGVPPPETPVPDAGAQEPPTTLPTPHPAPAPPPGAPPQIAGYQLLDQLGQGGMGQVYKARHLHMGRTVAVKLIRPDRLTHADAVRRFQREARAAARLAHPNIVTVYDSGHAGGTHFLVMEYVAGTDLARLVRESGPLPIARACAYVRQAALGLQHAFERGLTHRDIKPSNLLCSAADATVKLLDLGLARLDNPEQSGESDLTDTSTLMGTPDFIAPEQARDARAADIRSDLYSLGCTLYYLLTGSVPFPGGSLTEKLLKHQFDDPRPLEELRPEMPPALRAVVRRLMAKEPENRYPTPAEAAAALAPFTGEGGPDAGDAGPSAPVPVMARPSSKSLRPVDLDVGNGYRLRRRLGVGGFSEVWRAEGPDGTSVAVKILLRPLDPEDAQQDLEALRQLLGLRHPSLLSVFACWQWKDRLALALELADGSLRDRLRLHQAAGLEGVPVDELLPYLRQTAEALDFLHGVPVLHRDVKPDNLLLVGGQAKLADFALLQVVERARRRAETSILGAPAYMAPEAWRGRACAGSDQYALALTYAEVRLGRRPVVGDDLAKLMFEHLQGVPDLSALPEAERRVIHQALAKDPQQRYPHCVAFVEALQRAARPEPGPPEEPAPPDPAPSAAAPEPPAVSGGRKPQRWTWPGASRGRTAMLVGATLLAFLLPAGILHSNRVSAVRGLIRHSEFAAATRALDDSAWLLAGRGRGLRGEILAAWTAKAQEESDGGDHARALQTLRELLQADPLPERRDEVVALYRQVLARHVGRLTADGQFRAAADALKQLPGVDVPGKDRLREAVATAWTSKAEALLKGRKFDEAETEADAILNEFKSNASGDKIRREARGERLAAAVAQLVDEQKYRQAGELLRKSPEVPSKRADDLRKLISDKQAELARRLNAEVDRDVGGQAYVSAFRTAARGAELADGGAALRARVRDAVLEKVRADYEANDKVAAAELFENVNSFLKDDPAYQKLGQKVRPGAVDAATLAKYLRQADTLLDQDAAQAQALYAKVANGTNATDRQRAQAKRGEARALARLGQWADVRPKLREVGQLDPTEAAYRDALDLLAAEAAGTNASGILLGRLGGLAGAEGRFALVERSWEGDQLRAQAEKVLRDLPDLQGVPLETVVDVAGLAYGPAHHRTQFYKAYKQCLDGDYQGSRATLAAVKAADLPDTSKAEHKALEAFVLARDPRATAADRSKVLTLFAESFPSLAPPRRAEMWLAAADVAGRDDMKARLAEAVPLLGEKRLDVSEADRKPLDARYAELEMQYNAVRGGLVTGQIAGAADAARKALDAGKFKEARQALDKAKRLAGGRPEFQRRLRFMEALYAARNPVRGQEPELLKQAPRLLTGPSADVNQADQMELVEALTGLAEREPAYRASVSGVLDQAVPKLPPAAGYAAYVRALSGEDKAGAAYELMKALGPAGVPPVLKLEARRKRAVEVLQRAAAELLSPSGLDIPFVGKDGAARKRAAGQAYDWLSRARALLEDAEQPVPPLLAAELALAAYYKERPEPEVATKLADELAKPEKLPSLGATALPVLVVKARAAAQAAKGPSMTAFEAYEAAVDYLGSSGRQEDPDGNATVELYKAILAPATELGEALLKQPEQSAGLKGRLARLYFIKGRYISDALYADWPAFRGGPQQEAFNAFTRAIELSGSRGDYYVHRAYARYLLPKFDWKDMEADANKALQFAPESSGSHGLDGFVRHHLARGQKDYGERLRMLRSAVKSLDEAVDLARTRGTGDLSTQLLNRGAAHLELGNYLHFGGNDREARKSLDQARADSQAALEANPRYPELAEEALGNVLEALAQFFGEKEKYGQAVEPFTQAINFRPGEARYRLDRGRCQYQRVKVGGEDARFLKDAAADLSDAVSPRRRATPSERLKAYDWLGAAHLALKDWEAAAEDFRQAVGLLRQGHSSDMAAHCWQWMAAAVADAQKAGTPAEAVRVLAEAVRERAALLHKEDPIQAAEFLGDSYAVENKPVKALQTYNAALPGPLTKDRVAYVPLVIARGRLLIADKYREVLRGQRLPDREEILKEADLAIRLIENDPATPDSVKGAAYGLAGILRKQRAMENRDGKGAVELYRTALDQLRKALVLAPRDAGRAFWRIELERVISSLLYDPGLSAAYWKELQREGLEQLTLALEEAPEYRTLILRNRNELRARRRDN